MAARPLFPVSVVWDGGEKSLSSKRMISIERKIKAIKVGETKFPINVLVPNKGLILPLLETPSL